MCANERDYMRCESNDPGNFLFFEDHRSDTRPVSYVNLAILMQFEE